MCAVDHAHTITRTGARKGKGEAGKPFLFLVFHDDAMEARPAGCASETETDAAAGQRLELKHDML